MYTCLSRQNLSFVATKVWLSWQNICCDKHIFVATKVLSWQIFVATNVILSWQKFCCNKLTVVATNTCLSWQNMYFVAAEVCLSRQKFCYDKHMFLATNICHHSKSFTCDKTRVFVMTNTCLLRQKLYLWQLPPMIVKSDWLCCPGIVWGTIWKMSFSTGSWLSQLSN